MKDLLKSFVDTSKLGGWVRAGVAAGLSLAIAHLPILKDVLDPATQTAIGVAVSSVVVGVWSHYVKS